MKLQFTIVVVIGLALLASACGATPTPTEIPPTTAPTETAVPATPTDSPTQAATEEPAEAEAEATAAYPTPNPNPECVAAPIPEDPNVPAVSDEDWVRGPEDAPYVLIEYADFQCPACSVVSPGLDEMVNGEEGLVRHVYRHFPLTSIHDKAVITGEAAEAAGAQGAFWDMYKLLYERQEDWSPLTAEEMPEVLSGYAEELGLDTEAFDEALAEHTYEDKVTAGYDESVAIGLMGTPSFIVDGIHYPAQQIGFSPEAFTMFFSLIDMKRLQFDGPPPTVIEEGKQYEATIKTDKGDIVAELYADETPLTVNSFVYLAQEGWFDNTLWHRVVPGFVAQAGDPSATGIGWPGYRCSDELNQDLAFDGAGVLGMANSGADTNGSQFFITLDAQPSLNGKHSVFGRVISGMDVVESLSERDPQTVLPDAPGDHILSIEITEK